MQILPEIFRISAKKISNLGVILVHLHIQREKFHMMSKQQEDVSCFSQEKGREGE